jgi:hypothetical protein
MAVRHMMTVAFAHIGAEMFVGPRPPCDKEKSLKAVINSVREELGKPRRK